LFCGRNRRLADWRMGRLWWLGREGFLHWGCSDRVVLLELGTMLRVGWRGGRSCCFCGWGYWWYILILTIALFYLVGGWGARIASKWFLGWWGRRCSCWRLVFFCSDIVWWWYCRWWLGFMVSRLIFWYRRLWNRWLCY
jgi:hypothetical protein